jgi:hypothetical protein
LVFITYYGVIVATLSMLILLMLLLLQQHVVTTGVNLFLHLKIPAEKNGKIEIVFVLFHPSTYRSKTQPSKKQIYKNKQPSF